MKQQSSTFWNIPNHENSQKIGQHENFRNCPSGKSLKLLKLIQNNTTWIVLSKVLEVFSIFYQAFCYLNILFVEL